MVDYRIELVILPVSDVDRARSLLRRHRSAGRVDHDRTVDENTRFVQVTPPGSAVLDRLRRGAQHAWRPGSRRRSQVVVGSADEALARPAPPRSSRPTAWTTSRGAVRDLRRDPDGDTRWTVQELPDRASQASGA